MENELKVRIVVERPAKPLTPAQCNGFLRKEVAKVFPDIVEGFLNEAVKGGCAHLKMAAEVVAPKESDSRPRVLKGSAELLLEKFNRQEFTQ